MSSLLIALARICLHAARRCLERHVGGEFDDRISKRLDQVIAALEVLRGNPLH